MVIIFIVLYFHFYRHTSCHRERRTRQPTQQVGGDGFLSVICEVYEYDLVVGFPLGLCWGSLFPTGVAVLPVPGPGTHRLYADPFVPAFPLARLLTDLFPAIQCQLLQTSVL